MKRYIVFAALALLIVCALCVSVSAECYDCGGEFVDGICSNCGGDNGDNDEADTDVWYCQDCGALANEMECLECLSSNVDTVKPKFAVCPNCDTSFRVTESGEYQCRADDCREFLWVSADGHVLMYSRLPEIDCPCCPEFMTQGYDAENNTRLLKYICQYCGFALYLKSDVSADSYNEGYTDGYNDGHSDGMTDGYNEGYDEGKADGFDEGYDEGYNKGHDAGTENGEQSGFASGYDVGLEEGYNEGKTDGYNEGYDVGLDDGWNVGYADAVDEGVGRYDHGFRDGVVKGESNDVSGKFVDIVGEIAFAPYRAVSAMFDFEIFGINIAGLIFELITIFALVAIAFVVIKLFV